MSVQRLTEEDWATYRDIRLRALRESPAAFGSTHERELAFTEPEWRVRSHGMCVVLGADGRPVAVGGTYDEGERLHVVAVWTDPAERGRGHATAILHALVDHAAAAGRVVVLDVNLANPEAIAVYERFGFERTGVTSPLRPGSTETTQTMRLR